MRFAFRGDLFGVFNFLKLNGGRIAPEKSAQRGDMRGDAKPVWFRFGELNFGLRAAKSEDPIVKLSLLFLSQVREGAIGANFE